MLRNVPREPYLAGRVVSKLQPINALTWPWDNFMVHGVNTPLRGDWTTCYHLKPRAHERKGGLIPCLAKARWPPTVGWRGGGQATRRWLTSRAGRSRPPPPPSASAIKKLFFFKKNSITGWPVIKNHLVYEIRCV